MKVTGLSVGSCDSALESRRFARYVQGHIVSLHSQQESALIFHISVFLTAHSQCKLYFGIVTHARNIEHSTNEFNVTDLMKQ